MRYIVKISPALRNQSAVTKHLTRLLGPEESDKARRLTQNGGIAIQDLNERAANEVADALRGLGVYVEIIKMEESDPRKGFKVILVEAGNNKIALIKELLKITGLGLKEAKKLVENPGEIISLETSKEAHTVKKKLTSVGAKVTIANNKKIGSAESVKFAAKINGSPTEFVINLDGNVTDLDRVSEINFGRSSETDNYMNTLFSLSVSDADMSKLEGLMITVKYKF